jgi:DNA-binding IclR family transcriptional regulator
MKCKAFTSLERALDILSLFDLDCTSLTARQIANHLNLPLSTTYKYIDVLSKRGFLARKAGSKNFCLGLMLFRLGNVFISGFDLIDVVIPHMKALLKESGETILLTAVEGQEAICLEKMEPQRLIKLSLDRGRTLPLHAGASSRILLAYQDDAFINTFIKQQGLQKLTKNTITTLGKLRAELKRTREKGYAVSDSEVDAGAKAVSAPIFDYKGQLLAGLSIAGPSERIDNDLLSDFILMVKEKSAQISRDFSHTNE